MKVHKKVARADIYAAGLRTPAGNKQGYTLDRSKPSGESDHVVVQKGQQYYSWKSRYGPLQISLTYPKPQQLTSSDFMIQVYDFQDEVVAFSDIDNDEDLRTARQDLVDRIMELRDEQDDKKSNMPDSLQESPTAELLQERYDALDEWITELESVDLEEDNFESEEDAMQWLSDKIQEIQDIGVNL